MQKRFRIWQNFRCTRLYTNTRSSTTWTEESQIRQEHFFVSFSKHVRSHSIPVTPFENEMKSVSSLHPSAEAVNFDCTLLETASTEETSHRSHCWKLCLLIDAGPLAERRSRGDDLAFKANRNWNFMSSFSFECKMDFRKLFVGSPGNEDSITKTAKVPQAVQAVFFFFFFFFLPFSQFFFFFLLKSWPTSKWDQETWSFLYPSRSFAQ